jgi:hypothetical protein
MDFVIADRFAEDANVDHVDEEGKNGLTGIPEGWMVTIGGWSPIVIEKKRSKKNRVLFNTC